MRNGVCPKCDSRKVYHEGNQKGRAYWLRHRGPYVNILCAECGYSERYVLSKQHLAKASEEWTPINESEAFPDRGNDPILDHVTVQLHDEKIARLIYGGVFLVLAVAAFLFFMYGVD